MKAGHPIRVNRARERDRSCGEWAERDPVSCGRVQVLSAGGDPISQAQTVVAELRRLSRLTSDWSWSSCAVVAREWSYLDPVRSLCELEGIPVQMADEEFSGFWHLRETQSLVNWLRRRRARLVTSGELNDWVGSQPSGPWIDLLSEATAEYELETSGAETSVDHFVEWLAEWGRDVRRRQRGLLLLTAHRAKGLEFDHVVVLDGGWDRVGRGEDVDAPRRLYYVAMTRARQTLTLAGFSDSHPFHDLLRASSSVLHRREPVELPPPAPELTLRYQRLSLSDVFLSFAGYRQVGHGVHRAISTLSSGDRLQLRLGSNRWELVDLNGMVVGQLAGSFQAPSGMRGAFATVLAIVTWDKERSEPQYRDGLKCDEWEVVIPELVFEPDA